MVPSFKPNIRAIADGTSGPSRSRSITCGLSTLGGSIAARDDPPAEAVVGIIVAVQLHLVGLRFGIAVDDFEQARSIRLPGKFHQAIRRGGLAGGAGQGIDCVTGQLAGMIYDDDDDVVLIRHLRQGRNQVLVGQQQVGFFFSMRWKANRVSITTNRTPGWVLRNSSI